MKTDLTAERARYLLDYDKTTGVLTRRVALSNSTAVGETVGYSHPAKKYLYAYVDGKRYFVHRVIWLWMTGEWPEFQVDHADGDRTNNRWVNLRQLSAAENSQNRREHSANSSGLLGVSWMSKANKWRAQICRDKKVIYLGLFERKEEAQAAYLKAKRKLHPASTI